MRAPTAPEALRAWVWRLLGWGLAAAALAAVFALYAQPDFLLTLANQLWACF